jgi:hypothetical protein
MSETETNVVADSPAASPPPLLPPPAPVKVRPDKTAARAVWPVFFVLGFLILAGGEAYLWRLEQGIAGQATQLAVLQAQMDDMRAEAAKAAPAPDSVNVQADLAMKLTALAAQVNAVQAQAAADHGTLSTLQANSADLTKLTARIALLNQIETARMALDAGQPLGDIPNAPPALAQFAGTAPPMEAQLRLSFPEAARAAESASIAGDAKGSRWSRALARLESLITISNGSHVLIGAPAAGVIAQAQALLEAGDLAGAVAQLDTLSESTQEAMGNWLVQARALVAARAAMISMAGQG